MPNRRVSQWIVAAVACFIAFAVFETAGRLLVRPDPRGYGSLLGVVLPPLRLLAPEPEPVEARDRPYRGLIVDGMPITVGDVAGYHRYDANLGYATLENAASVHGWWQSNEIGARESGPTEPLVAPGKTRWLLLGESFAHGSGLPGRQTWPEIAEAAEPALDIVNLAVDGYSMAQAYLRYGEYAARLDHQGVLLMFAPGVDLWRDINVVRELGEPWIARSVMPRFELAGAGIRLAPNPYRSADELEMDLREGPGPKLRAHLERHDRFYFPPEHESVPVVGHLLSFKVAVAAWGRYARGRLRRAQFAPGSEAAEISRRISLRLQEEAGARSRAFVLLILPTAGDLDRMRRDPDFATAWERFTAASCAGLRHCVDLAPELAAVPPSDVDLGPDGNHFGPRMNAVIADAVRDALAARGVIRFRPGDSDEL
jgi:hypothetical protein